MMDGLQIIFDFRKENHFMLIFEGKKLRLHFFFLLFIFKKAKNTL